MGTRGCVRTRRRLFLDVAGTGHGVVYFANRAAAYRNERQHWHSSFLGGGKSGGVCHSKRRDSISVEHQVTTLRAASVCLSSCTSVHTPQRDRRADDRTLPHSSRLLLTKARSFADVGCALGKPLRSCFRSGALQCSPGCTKLFTRIHFAVS